MGFWLAFCTNNRKAPEKNERMKHYIPSPVGIVGELEEYLSRFVARVHDARIEATIILDTGRGRTGDGMRRG